MSTSQTHYLDTSALISWLDRGDPMSDRMTSYLRTSGLLVTGGLWASSLTRLEAARVAVRVGEPMIRSIVDGLFHVSIHEVAIDAEVIERAMSLPQPVKSLDAIHLATALGARARQTFISYDKGLLAAASAQGLQVESP